MVKLSNRELGVIDEVKIAANEIITLHTHAITWKTVKSRNEHQPIDTQYSEPIRATNRVAVLISPCDHNIMARQPDIYIRL